MLSALKIYIQSLKKYKKKEVTEELHKQLELTIDETIYSLAEVSNNLSPHVLHNFGLKAALKNYINKIKNLKNIQINVSCDLPNRLENKIEIALFRVTTELMNNSIKYSNANSIKVNVSINKTLEYTYIENGKGFDLKHTIANSKGMGLKNIVNRIEAISGTIDINSSNGVKVLISIPLY